MTTGPHRRRVLFVAEAVTLAHPARANLLARYLDPTMFEVHLAWDPRYNDVLGPLSSEFHPIESLPTATFLKRLARGAPMHDTATLRRYVEDDLAVIERVAPDVIVGDFRLSLAASARLADVPLVTVANAYWSPYARQTFQFPQYDYPLSRIVSAPVARALFRAFRNVGFAAHTRPLNTVLREHGLPSIGHDIRVMYTYGDYTVYVDVPELVPTYDLPANHGYIGPVLWSPAVEPPRWWTDLPTDRPIVYVTPGSSGEGNLVSLALDALADAPVTVIAATAGHSGVERVPSNARIAPFLPGAEAAARAALVVCNGGSPTAWQALAASVPVLGIASNNMDQHLNMDAVHRAGAGEVVRARGLRAAPLRTLVMRMLETPRYRTAAAALAGAQRRYEPRIRFPALIEELT